MNINDDAIRAAMSRHPAGKHRKPVRLTPRGQHLLLATYQALLIAAAIATFILVMGLVGWIEGN